VRADGYLVNSRVTEGSLYCYHKYSSSSYYYYCYYYYYYYYYWP